MSGGLLGRALSSTNAYVKVYTLPSNKIFSVANIIILNTSSINTSLVLAISKNPVPTAADIVIFNRVVGGNASIRKPLIMSPGESVYILAGNSSTIARVSGITKDY
jgi:hypothetical protein